MRYRMHKRVETKPDGRKIYYYTFEPAQGQERQTPSDAPAEPAPREDADKREATNAVLGRVKSQ